METVTAKIPKIRHEKNFVVEENVDAVRWPQECEACGGPVNVSDSIKMKENFKGFGEINVGLEGIPYCSTCYPKIRTGKKINRAVWILAFVIGIPLGILLLTLAFADQNTTVVMCGVLMLIGLATGYGLAWLFVKLPAKILLKGKFVEPVDAWLISEKKKDGKEGISVVISIPNKIYAVKFMGLNGISA